MAKKELNLPVVIIGAGPAGIATAIALARVGIPAVIFEPYNNYYKPDEIIPADAYPVFRQLGIDYILHDPQHKQNMHHLHAWGLSSTEALQHQMGNGWYINRRYFEKQLRWAAERLKVQWLTGLTFIDFEEKESHICVIAVTNQGEQLEIAASFAVDASGRKACLAHQAGASRIEFSSLTCYHISWPSAAQGLTNTSLIEATGDGWWHALPEKNGHLSVNYFTDDHLQQVATDRLTGWIFDNTEETVHLKSLIATSPQGKTTVTARQASTSILDQLAGRYWLAVGDAAFTTEPILSAGLATALQSSLQAAISIKEYLAGNTNTLGTYASIQRQTLYNYLKRLQQQYTLETRWPDRPFWQRRHALVQALP